LTVFLIDQSITIQFYSVSLAGDECKRVTMFRKCQTPPNGETDKRTTRLTDTMDMSVCLSDCPFVCLFVRWSLTLYVQRKEEAVAKNTKFFFKVCYNIIVCYFAFYITGVYAHSTGY